MANEVVFEPSLLASPLRQGEILSDLSQFVYDPEREEVDQIPHSFCVVASQDCDLTRDFNARKEGGEGAHSNLLLVASPVEEARNAVGPSHIWKQARQNSLERWQVLEPAVGAQDLQGEGFSSLVIDFRRFFSINPLEIYRQLLGNNEARRRSVLLSPYREHVQSRAAAFWSRVALEREHNV